MTGSKVGGSKQSETKRRKALAAGKVDKGPFVAWWNERLAYLRLVRLPPGPTERAQGKEGFIPFALRHFQVTHDEYVYIQSMARRRSEARYIDLHLVDKVVTGVGRPDLLHSLYPDARDND